MDGKNELSLAANQEILDPQDSPESAKALRAEAGPWAGSGVGFIEGEDGFSVRERLFVRKYSEDFNLEEACRFAKNGSLAWGRQLLLRKDIAEAIERRVQKEARIEGATAGYVIDALVEVIEFARKKTPIYDRRGQVIGHGMVDANAVIKASVSLGQALGIFQEGPPKKEEEAPAAEEMERIDIAGLAEGLLNEAIDKIEDVERGRIIEIPNLLPPVPDAGVKIQGDQA